MNALLRALTDSRGIENIEQALGMPDITSDAMRRAIDGWFDAWFSRVPPDEEDPCQRIPYAVVNKLGKAVFAEYDSSLQNTGTPKLQYLDRARQAFDAKKRELLQWCMVGGETWAKPVFAPDGLTWQVIRRDAVLILGRAPDGRVTDLACCEKSVVADRQYYTLVERRTTGPDGRLTIENRLYQADNKATLGRRVPLQSLAQYERLADAYTYPAPLDGLGLVALKMPTVNCVDGSPDGVAVYEPAMGLIHRINQNELQLSREFELGRMRVVASADLLHTSGGQKALTDDVFVGLDGNEQSLGMVNFTVDGKSTGYFVGGQTKMTVKPQDLNVPYYSLHNHPSNGILSPEDIQQLIKRPLMKGIGAVGNAGALYTCEKTFGYSTQSADEWFRRLRKKYPLYKGGGEDVETILAQRIAFAEELRRDGAKHGLAFSG